MLDTPKLETPACRLFQNTLTRLGSAITLSEVCSVDNKPWRSLTSHAPFHDGACGHVRLFLGHVPLKIVTCSLFAPAIGLDSHMLFAFTPTICAVPHFTLDCVQSSEQMALHLDLLPRLDLATHLAYMDWGYAGLSDLYATAANLRGLSPAHISLRQRATMSPWMIANRATPDAFFAMEPIVQGYLDHWLSLVARGAPQNVLDGATPADLAARDRASRAVIFDPNVDPVWGQIRGLIGTDSVEAIRAQLLQFDV